MAAQTFHQDVTYPTTLRMDDTGDVVTVVVQPIVNEHTTPAAPPTLTAPATTTPEPHQAAPDQLKSDNLSTQDKGFDPLLDAAQKAVKALDLQRAGNKLGFHLALQHCTNDRFDLPGWTRQQAQ